MLDIGHNKVRDHDHVTGKLSNNDDFKYLLQEFSGEQLKLVKQKNMNIWTVLNSFLKVNYMIRGNFIVF